MFRVAHRPVVGFETLDVSYEKIRRKEETEEYLETTEEAEETKRRISTQKKRL